MTAARPVDACNTIDRRPVAQYSSTGASKDAQALTQSQALPCNATDDLARIGIQHCDSVTGLAGGLTATGDQSMALSIAGRLVQHPTAISATGRQTLAFIDGGAQWVHWATQSPGSRFDFPDETSLVSELQKGLHGTPYAWLPVLGIRISPIKLMTLGTADLRALGEAESGSQTPAIAAQVQQILSSHSIVRALDPAGLTALLEQLGAGKAPLLTTLDLPETLALAQLAAQLTDAHTRARREEAAEFALDAARSPLEFCDYYRFYLERPFDGTSTSEARIAEARYAMGHVLPYLFDALDGVQLSGLPAPMEVSRAISQHIAHGKTLGFSRLSLALQQLARATDTLDSSIDVGQAVHRHMRAAMDALASHDLRNGVLGQDGNSARFQITHADRQLVVAVDNGLVTIADLGLPASTAHP